MSPVLTYLDFSFPLLPKLDVDLIRYNLSRTFSTEIAELLNHWCIVFLQLIGKDHGCFMFCIFFSIELV